MRPTITNIPGRLHAVSSIHLLFALLWMLAFIFCLYKSWLDSRLHFPLLFLVSSLSLWNWRLAKGLRVLSNSARRGSLLYFGLFFVGALVKGITTYLLFVKRGVVPNAFLVGALIVKFFLSAWVLFGCLLSREIKHAFQAAEEDRE